MSKVRWEDLEEIKETPDEVSWEDVEEVKPTTGMRGIGEDIKASLAGTPGVVGELLKNLPREAYLSGKQAVFHPIRATENVIAGLLEGLKGAVNIPSYVGEYLGEKQIPGFKQAEPYLKRLRIPETGLQKAVLGEEQPGDVLLQGLGQFAPYSRIGAGARGLTGVAKRAAGAGAFGLGQQGDPLQAALLSSLTEGALKGIPKGARATATSLGRLKPSRLIKTPLGAEQLEKALEITKGTETGLGEVIENPFLQRQYQNVLSQIPFSGANQAMQNTAKMVTERGYNILDDLIKDAPENSATNIGEQLKTALLEAKKDAQSQKRANFKDTNDYADKIKLKIGRNNFSLVAQETLEDMKQSPELMRETDPQLLKDLRDYSDSSIENNLKLTNIFRSKLGDKASQSFREGDNYKYNLYRTMKEALDKDIEEAINTSDSTSLKDKYKKDMQFYKENIAPFEDRDIMKFTNREGDPDTITNAFLKISNVSDRSNLLKKLQDKLPADKKNLLGYAYFSRALDEGKLNPMKFKTLYNRLGNNQRKVLIPDDKMRARLKDYTSLVSKNTEPLNIMFNPQTGQRAISELAHYLPALSGLASGLFTGSIPAGVIGTAAAPILGRAATRYLTSPAKRAKLIQKIIEEKRKVPKSRKQTIDPNVVREYLRSAIQAGAANQQPTQ